ncbi:hypothetical protein H0A71_13970 [Alcaligenaceae bacterium]|nr:hypothetical protein [Alcaligenaceae bacterium]
MAASLDELCKGSGSNSRVFHLKTKLPQNTADHIWISALAAEGGWAAVRVPWRYGSGRFE